LLDH
jgi:hypothetical protein